MRWMSPVTSFLLSLGTVLIMGGTVYLQNIRHAQELRRAVMKANLAGMCCASHDLRATQVQEACEDFWRPCTVPDNE